MIEVKQLTKSFGNTLAVDHVSFTARNGRVTGFVGPNGSGKSTTMKTMLGLLPAESGQAYIDGKPYRDHRAPLTIAGAVLDARSAHKGMRARDYLMAVAATHGIGRTRVEAVMQITGIQGVAKKRAGTFSLGMSQRLSIAAALLGDPKNIILDEPVNGLDPEGVMWVRSLCKYLASEGRAVLLSSHLMSEVALTADDLVIIGRGRVLREQSLQSFVDEHSAYITRIVTPQPQQLCQVLEAMQTRVEIMGDEQNTHNPQTATAQSPATLRVYGMPVEQLGAIIAQYSVIVYELTREKVSLEEAFMQLTHSEVQYQSVLPQAQGNASTQVHAVNNQEGVR